MTTVLAVPGTFESHSVGRPAGMLRQIGVELGDDVTVTQVNYPAQYGNPMAYADSVEAGVRALLAAARAAGGLLILVGFSQGAVVVARLAAEIRDGKHPDLHVVLVVTIANPERAVGEYAQTGVGVRVNGSGVAGGRSLRGCPFHVVQLAIPGDVITDASADSLVRDLADLSDYMSPNVGQWAAKVLGKLTTGRLQNLRWWENAAWMVGRTPARIATAIAEVSGYPKLHTQYGIRNMPGLSITYLDYAIREIRAHI